MVSEANVKAWREWATENPEKILIGLSAREREGEIARLREYIERGSADPKMRAVAEELLVMFMAEDAEKRLK